MSKLLARIIDAHGGIERWTGYEKIDATIVSGGAVFPLKGVVQDPNPRSVSYRSQPKRSRMTSPARSAVQCAIPSPSSSAPF